MSWPNADSRMRSGTCIVALRVVQSSLVVGVNGRDRVWDRLWGRVASRLVGRLYAPWMWTLVKCVSETRWVMSERWRHDALAAVTSTTIDAEERWRCAAHHIWPLERQEWQIPPPLHLVMRHDLLRPLRTPVDSFVAQRLAVMHEGRRSSVAGGARLGSIPS